MTTCGKRPGVWEVRVFTGSDAPGSATVAVRQGHDVRTVAGRLGHADPGMTLRVYAHAFAAADQAVAAALGEILKGDS